MKFGVSQEVFKSALDIGALAAVSDTAQVDDETIALLTKSVNITADKELAQAASITQFVPPRSKR